MVDRVTLKPITAEDVFAREEEEEVAREIINGEWAEDNEMASKGHGRIGGRLITFLSIYLMSHPVGEAYQDNTNYVLKGTRRKIEIMRVPDVSFVRAERVDHDAPDDMYYLAPDLAVEIISSSERRRKIADKVKDYLTYGTRQVWVIYPDVQQVIVHHPDGETKTYGIQDSIEGGDLLPAFSVKVADILG